MPTRLNLAILEFVDWRIAGQCGLCAGNKNGAERRGTGSGEREKGV